MKTVLVTTIYKDENKARYSELITCLCENAFCDEIDKIVVLVDADFPEPVTDQSKIQYHRLHKRPTYQDAFDYANNYPCDIKIVSNGDIFFRSNSVVAT